MFDVHLFLFSIKPAALQRRLKFSGQLLGRTMIPCPSELMCKDFAELEYYAMCFVDHSN